MLRYIARLDDEATCSIESSSCTSGVDALRRGLRRRSQRSVIRDAVSVAVGRDSAPITSPRSGLALTAGWLAKMLHPRFAGLTCGVEHGISASFDHLAPLIECLPHIACHRAVRSRDESGDQPRRLASTTRASRACCGARNAVVQHRGDVVGIGEPAGCHESREQSVEVVVVGLGTAQLRGERTERLGLDRGVRLVGCQARGLDQGGPAVSLGGGSNRLVLRGELGDRPHCSCSVVMVSCADSSAPTCCRTP